jgi:aspartate/methionine/tyrosine aminotransferase
VALSSKYHQALKLNYTNDLYGLALKRGDCIFLTGSCPLPTAKFVYEELLKSFVQDSKFCSYNTGMPGLKTAIKTYIKEHSGIDIDIQKRLLITLGATTFLQQLFIYLFDEDRECLVITPTFQDYFNQLRTTLCRITEVPMRETGTGWEVDFKLVKKNISPKTKAILLCSPNNPTGKVYTEQELRQFCQLAKDNNLYLILDEAYNYLIYRGTFVSPLSFPEFSENVIAARTFSKEFGMCGWRVGYAVVPEAMKDELFHYQLSFNTVPAAISQKAAEICLSNKDSAQQVKNDVNATKAKRDMVMDRVKKMGKDLSLIVPDGCVYLYVKYGKNITSYELCKDIINKTGVIVSPGIGNGKGGEEHFCITFADSSEILTEGLNRLEKYFSEYY